MGQPGPRGTAYWWFRAETDGDGEFTPTISSLALLSFLFYWGAFRGSTSCAADRRFRPRGYLRPPARPRDSAACATAPWSAWTCVQQPSMVAVGMSHGHRSRHTTTRSGSRKSPRSPPRSAGRIQTEGLGLSGGARRPAPSRERSKNGPQVMIPVKSRPRVVIRSCAPCWNGWSRTSGPSEGCRIHPDAGRSQSPGCSRRWPTALRALTPSRPVHFRHRQGPHRATY